MCIFLCLSNSSLFQAVSSQKLTKGIGNRLFFKCNQLISNGFIVIGKAYKGSLHSLTAIKACKLIITENAGHLSCPVGTEIVENNRISVFDGCYRGTVFHHYHRHNKLISFAVIIGSLNSCNSALCLNALALCQCLIGNLLTIPVLISIHCIVAACYSCYLTNAQLSHLGLQSCYIIFSRCWRSITAIQEAVYIDLAQAIALCQLQQTINMSNMAVNAAVRNQSEHMQSRIVLFAVFYCCHKCLVFKKITILNGFGNTGQLLINNTSCTHVQVSYLRVSHLSFRKTNCHSAGLSFYERTLTHQLIHHWGFSFTDSIGLALVV